MSKSPSAWFIYQLILLSRAKNLYIIQKIIARAIQKALKADKRVHCVCYLDYIFNGEPHCAV
jgi:hypothetical protein